MRDRISALRRFTVSVLILAVFVVAAQHFVGWRQLAHPWLTLDDPLLVLIAVALLGCTYLIRAFRIYRYFRLHSGFGRCLCMLVQHTALVNLLPMRAGELAFPALMNRHFGMAMHTSVPALLWLRALDLHVLLGVPIVVVAMLGDAAASRIAAAAAVAWVLSLFAVRFSSRALASFAAGREGPVFRVTQSVLAAIPASPRGLVEDWLLTLANWLLKLTVFAWVIQIFSSQDYLASLAGAIGGEVTGLLPIQGLAGFGTYEAGTVAAMQALRASPHAALTGAINLHLLVLGVSVCAAALTLLFPTPAPGRQIRPIELPGTPPS